MSEKYYPIGTLPKNSPQFEQVYYVNPPPAFPNFQQEPYVAYSPKTIRSVFAQTTPPSTQLPYEVQLSTPGERPEPFGAPPSQPQQQVQTTRIIDAEYAEASLVWMMFVVGWCVYFPWYDLDQLKEK